MSPTDITRLVLSVMITFGFGGVLIAWMYWPPGPENSNLMSALVGGLGAGYLQVLGYWFTRSPPEQKP